MEPDVATPPEPLPLTPAIAGTTATALGAEGAAPGTDWAGWEAAGRVPRSNDGNGFRTRYADDFVALAAAGITDHRITVDWGRIEPRQGKVDGSELEHLVRVFDAADNAGVRLWVALHHIAVPTWFADEGGFADDKARGRHWPRFVDTVAQTVGDRAGGWFPMLEPTWWAIASTLRGSLPPWRKDPKACQALLAGTFLAWRDAWRVLRGGGPPVATWLTLAPVHPAEMTLEATDEARVLTRMLWDLPIRAFRDGILAVPGRHEVEVPDLRDSADLIGVVYRGAFAVDGEGRRKPYPPERAIDGAGWANWPEGLPDALDRLAEGLPGRKLVVGTEVAATGDDQRADIVGSVLQALYDVQRGGLPVVGFWHPGIDGYDPRRGFTAPVGCFDRDRNPKGTATLVAGAATQLAF